jgi:cyclopropane fatty-acyl-phospholipid synthase-like methyltransferase
MQLNSTSGLGAADLHASYSWDPSLRLKPPFVADTATFAQAMSNPHYPRSAKWCPEWIFHNTMGPINLWPAEALAARMDLRPGMKVLDLGCGAATTSIFLALEFDLQVWAVDLWIAPESNVKRIDEAGLTGKVFAGRAGAHRLPYDLGFFDAVISIDAYHYFGTEVRYLSYLSQYLRPGGEIGIVVPGNAVDPDDPSALGLESTLAAQMGADWFTFRSADWWRKHWSYTSCVDVELAEMLADGEDIWRRWIAAERAAFGAHPNVELNAQLVGSPAGQTMGFCLVTARRNDKPGLDLGIGDYQSYIA